jgi:hypothetical protein
MQRLNLGAFLVVAAVLAAGCGGSSGAPADQNGGGPGGASATATFPLKPVPGNSVGVPIPSDAPAKVAALSALPSCGAEVLFEEDVDITPIPTPPGPTTNPSDNQLATACLLAAWENGTPAQLIVSETSDEADSIYSIYRLPGDGTLQLLVRVLSHSDQTVAWTQRTCRQLSLQDGVLTPADCDAETPIG